VRYVPAAGRVGLVCLIGLCGVASPGVASPAFPGTERPLIAIDVGHSRSRPGAVSARGEPEFTFNRGLALVVERVLRDRGFRTRLIAEQGDIEKLTDRSAAAASAGAAFFLSLHHDSVQPQYLAPWQVDGQEQRYSDRFSGFSLFVSRSNSDAGQSLYCARAIGERLRASGYIPSPHHAEPIRGENRPLADASNGVYYFDDLVVLKTATMPAVLVEAGIIVNRRDELILVKASTRERLATAIAEGLRRCLGRGPP
jgi:N-acetylmuramoyl-L-alanine amidase